MTDNRFDVHEIRHGLKLLRDTGTTTLFDNRKGFDCPACGDAYDQLFVSEERTNSFNSPERRFCVLREPDRIVLFTHS